jgi:RHS repeat-associated protein
MRSGAFEFAHTDMTLGPATPPLGLSLTREYSSANALDAGPMGRGWRINHFQRAVAHSVGAGALEQRGAADAASIVAAAHTILDLLSVTPDALRWAAASLVSKWGMDELIGNAVSVHSGDATLTFLKNAGGGYGASPLSGCQISVSGGGFQCAQVSGSVRTFDADGRITATTDANGNSMICAYDGSGRLTGVTDCFGKTLTFTYNGGGQIATVTHGGRSVHYTYADGNLVGYRDASGVEWGYAYDGSNRLARIFKAAPSDVAEVVNEYDSFGRVRTQTDALGNHTAFFFSGYRNIESRPDGSDAVYGFDREGRFAFWEDGTGKRAVFTHNGIGQMVAVTDRLGNTSHRSYHPASGNLASETDASGNTRLYTYAMSGARSDLTRTDYPDGSHEASSFDGHGNLLSLTDRAGKVWNYAWNARGQLLSLQNPAGGSESFSYNADGTPATRTDSDTGTTTFSYDSLKRLIRTTRPDGTRAELSYDANDRITSFTDENGGVRSFTYDANGNAAAVETAFGTQQAAYDLMNQPVLTTDRLSRQTAIEYDTMYRPERVTDATGVAISAHYGVRGWVDGITRGGERWTAERNDEGVPAGFSTPLGHTTDETSDSDGRLKTTADPLSNRNSFVYDAMGNIAAVTNALDGTTLYGGTAAGLLASITQPSSAHASYEYNDLGLIRRIIDHKGSAWIFTYTAMGRLLTVQDPLSRTTQFAYDSRGRVRTVTYADGTVQSLTCDGVGNILRRSFSDGTDLQFAYDTANRIVASGAVTLARDAEGQVTATTDFGSSFGATRDNAGRLLSATYASGALVVTYHYSVGGAGSGLLTGVTDNVTGTVIAFEHDRDRRLTSVSFPGNRQTVYTWDAASRLERIRTIGVSDAVQNRNALGRIISVNVTAPLHPGPFIKTESSIRTFDAASQTVGTGYFHDSRGRVTADPLRNYLWDGASRLTAVNGVLLAYDALGNLRARTQDGRTVQCFHNHAIDRTPLVAERDAFTGDFLRHYVYTPSGRLLYMIDAAQGNAAHFYHFDHLGNTLALTDAAGNVTDAYAYDAYGRIVARSGSTEQPFTFGGAWGVRQEGAGGDFYQMRARYYDAVAGRFISPEPVWPQIWEPHALNPYQYAGADPVGRTDFTGLWWEDPSPLHMTPESRALHESLFLRMLEDPEFALRMLINRRHVIFLMWQELKQWLDLDYDPGAEFDPRRIAHRLRFREIDRKLQEINKQIEEDQAMAKLRKAGFNRNRRHQLINHWAKPVDLRDALAILQEGRNPVGLLDDRGNIQWAGVPENMSMGAHTLPELQAWLVAVTCPVTQPDD